jgi:hypothetical protein
MAPDRLGKILSPYLARIGLLQKMGEQRVRDCWEQIVGKAVAEATQPFRCRNRVFQVKVVSSVWMQELQFHKEMMIRKLNEFCGHPLVRDVWFFLGEKEKAKEIPAVGTTRKGAGENGDLSQEEISRMEREVGRLHDREMKEIFLRVFAKGLIAGKARGKSRGQQD